MQINTKDYHAKTPFLLYNKYMPKLFSLKKLKFPKKLLLKPKNRSLSTIKTLKKPNSKTKKIVAFSFLITTTVSVAFLFLIKGTDTEASWYNDNWQYRKAITIENSGSGVTNQQVKVEQDTATMITDGKLQSSCQDIRFTDSNGNLLKHRVGVAGSTSTITYDSSNLTTYADTSNPSSVSFSHTVASGTDNVLVVVVSAMKYQTGSNVFDVGTVTYNGTSLTNATEVDGYTTNRNYATSIWYLANPDTGSHTLAVNMAGSETVNEWVVGAMNFSGVDQTTVIRATASNTGDTTPLTATLTTTANNSVIVGGATNRGDFGTLAIDIGTEAYSVNSGDTSDTGANGAGGYISAPTAGSNSFTVSSTNSVNTVAGVELLASVTGTTGDLCNNASTDFYVLMPEINSGDNTIYMYYGNQTATTVESQDAFNQTIFSPVASTTRSEEVTPGPIFYMTFDKGYGTTAYDKSGQGNNGTITGATWTSEDMCVDGKCLYLNGSNQNITIPSDSNINFNNNQDFTISAWFKIDDLATDQVIIAKKDSSSSSAAGYMLLFNQPSNIVELRVSDGTDQFIVSSTAITDNSQWVYVSAVYVDGDATNSTIYINGQDAKDSTTGNIANVDSLSTTTDLVIGEQGNGSADYGGFIDNVAIYRYARTADEIAGDMNGGVVSQGNNSWLSKGLVGYWNMDESSWTNDCSTASVIDSSGNGNNGKSCPASTGPTGGSAGKFGNGGSFDGSDDYISINNDSALNDNPTFTACQWVYFDTLTQNVMSLNKDTNSGFYFQINTDGRFYTRYGTAEGYLGGTGTISTGEWTHICETFDGTTLTAYKNGVSLGTTTGYAPSGMSGTVYIGAASSSSYEMDGQIDETRIYNRALSPKEVRDLYAWAPGPVLH